MQGKNIIIILIVILLVLTIIGGIKHTQKKKRTDAINNDIYNINQAIDDSTNNGTGLIVDNNLNLFETEADQIGGDGDLE